MLLEKFNQMKITCAKLMGCNLALMIGVMMISDALEYRYEIPESACILGIVGLGAIGSIGLSFVKRLCVPLKILICPLAISLIPTTFVFLLPDDFVLFESIVGMFVLFILWTDRRFQKLPMELSIIDNNLKNTYPKICEKGIGRISDKQFLFEMNDALGQIQKKEYTMDLLDAISNWCAVYAGFCFLFQGMAFGIIMRILM